MGDVFTIIVLVSILALIIFLASLRRESGTETEQIESREKFVAARPRPRESPVRDMAEYGAAMSAAARRAAEVSHQAAPRIRE